GRALQRTFAAATVVAHDVDDQRVVEFTYLADRIDHSADVVVCVGESAGIDLGHSRIEPLLVGGQAVPGGKLLGPRRQLGIGWDDAKLLLACQRVLADLVPPLVELALELGDPLLRSVMRSVRRACRVVSQERSLRGGCLLLTDPIDGVVRQIYIEDVIRFAEIGFDGLRALHKRRVPLVGVAANEAVEVVEPKPCRPQIEWPSFAGLPVRHVVVLPIPRRVVPVLLEHLGKGSDAFWHQRVIAGIAGGELHDHTSVRRVMIASGDQRSTGWRAERRRMELRVAQPALRETVHRRRRNWPAERATGAVPDIIGENEQYVWSAGRGLNCAWEVAG